MITAFYHPGYAAPIGQHIMPIGKFALVAEGLRDGTDVRLVEPEPVGEVDILRVHTPEYLRAIQTGEPRALAESQKFPWSPELYASVCLTAGGCLAAGRQAIADGVSAALVSGFHHAEASHGQGFCTFNGLVITLDRLLAEKRIRHAAILDCDLHYGNGTASLVATRPHLFAFSLYGNDYKDNQAYRDVTTIQHTDGDNHKSAALPAGCDGERMLDLLEIAMNTHFKNRPCDLLLYQAGADPYFEDPYSPLAIDHADLKARDELVFTFAKRQGVPIAWVLAGGYTQDVNKVVRIHLNTFVAAHKVFG